MWNSVNKMAKKLSSMNGRIRDFVKSDDEDEEEENGDE